jgi:hypothetical protein
MVGSGIRIGGLGVLGCDQIDVALGAGGVGEDNAIACGMDAESFAGDLSGEIEGSLGHAAAREL